MIATELEALREERGHELKRIEEQREQAKEAVWSED